MNLPDPWNIFYLVCFFVYGWIRNIFINRTRDEKKVFSRFDGLEKTLLAAMFPGYLVTPALYLFTPWLSFADTGYPAWLQGAGATLMASSLWVFWRSHSDLGRNWSVSIELREGHELVTGGVYRRIRHPMYLSIWMWSIGQGLVLQNWLAGWLFLVTFAAMYFVRLPREEAMMLEEFGDQYRDYRKRTGRILPRLTGSLS